MRMQSLNNAAKAAGYAMATSDDLLTENKSRTGQAEAVPWRPGEAVLAQRPARKTPLLDWIKGLLSFGRRAPA
jgi:hypothetical protein